MNTIRPFHGIRPDKTFSLGHNNLVLSPDAIKSPLQDCDDKILSIFLSLKSGLLKKEQKLSYYVMRIQDHLHCFVGLVALVSLDLIGSKIFCHEGTLSDKQKKQMESFLTSRIQINPVLLMHRYSDKITQILNEITSDNAGLKLESLDQSKSYHLWMINDEHKTQNISRLYNTIDRFYVADGHHRIAAANQLKARENYLLCLLASQERIQIKSYHRLLKHLNGMSEEQFLNALESLFQVEHISNFDGCLQRNVLVLYMNSQFYKLIIKANSFIHTEYPYESHIVDHCIFSHILRMHDSLIEQVVQYLPNLSGISEIIQEINHKKVIKAAIFLPELEVERFSAICESKKNLPANSTWFEPKIPDGLICYERELTMYSSNHDVEELAMAESFGI